VAPFQSLPKSFEFAKAEENILVLWEQIDAFKRSVEQKKQGGKSPYTFYDGPPFATGLPHYGHMVASSIKDVVARYWTMRGHYVERRFGWDTHGLPIEMETEKTLGLSGPKSIRDYGIDKFNEACRAGVLRYTQEWRRIITRLGRWVDFDHDYKTMDLSFMESVWWAFSELWKKELVFQGFRVMPYSTRLSTPLSNFEANLNYQEVQDPAVTVRVKLRDKPDTYLLIWTTTPWTLPSNLAVAVGRDIDYVRVKSKDDGHTYIVAKALADKVFKHGHEILGELKGLDLLGKSYEPIYSTVDYARILGDAAKTCFRVIASDHVTVEDGVGLVHMAPSFGVDDFEACRREGMPNFDPLDEEGKFTALVPDLAGLSFKDADKVVLKHLKDEGKLFDRSTIVHSYPFCWRSNTPLIYKAVPVWFVDVPKLKERMVDHNASIHWVPEAVGHKRFANWLKDAADWSVSRNRFWGTPIPIWQCEHCQHQLCLSSAKELSDLSGHTITDLHSHHIDKLPMSCPQCKGGMKRVPEVFDCWFESGSMPVSQVHYPFENQAEFLRSFPADFIAEGLDQTRGWFYTLLVLSTALFDKPPFKNVVVNGMVLAQDGSKMSKSKKNYPDPETVINTYGSDAVRCYLMGSPVVRGEPLRFDEQGVKEVVRSVMLPLFNCWSFFVQYANIDDFDPKRDLEKAPSLKERPEIDQWIISKLQSLIKSVNTEMSGYYLYKTIPHMLSFIEDLTNWYIRRSRRRFWKSASDHQERMDKLAAYASLYEVMVTFSKVLAPLMPFISESIYQNLVVDAGMHKADEESIHLTDFPESDNQKINEALEVETELVRSVVAMGRALREKYRLKTRQPLKKITVVTHQHEAIEALLGHEELITSELNVRELEVLPEDDALCKVLCKPNFKTLGPRAGKDMAALGKEICAFSRQSIRELEDGGEIMVLGHSITLVDVVIIREALADVVVMNEGHITVALDTELDDDLKDEGLMREALSLLQRLRKSEGLEVISRIDLKLYTDSVELRRALEHHQIYVAAELLADELYIGSTGEASGETHKLDVEGEVLVVSLLPS
jgi:isoleucyl-tRNA synthetase